MYFLRCLFAWWLRNYQVISHEVIGLQNFPTELIRYNRHYQGRKYFCIIFFNIYLFNNVKCNKMLRNFSKYLRFKSKCVLILMPLFTPDTTIKRKCSIGEVFISFILPNWMPNLIFVTGYFNDVKKCQVVKFIENSIKYNWFFMGVLSGQQQKYVIDYLNYWFDNNV